MTDGRYFRLSGCRREPFPGPEWPLAGDPWRLARRMPILARLEKIHQPLLCLAGLQIECGIWVTHMGRSEAHPKNLTVPLIYCSLTNSGIRVSQKPNDGACGGTL